MRKRQTNHWFVAYEQGGELRLSGWQSRNRLRPGTKHLCGQTCLHKLVDEFMAKAIASRPQTSAASAVEVRGEAARNWIQSDVECSVRRCGILCTPDCTRLRPGRFRFLRQEPRRNWLQCREGFCRRGSWLRPSNRDLLRATGAQKRGSGNVSVSCAQLSTGLISRGGGRALSFERSFFRWPAFKQFD